MKEVEEVLKRKGRSEASRKTAVPVRVLAREAVSALLEKKVHDILVMDMHDVSGVADVFVLATGDSDLQIKAAVDAVRSRLKENLSERPWHLEGYEHRQWILIDYVDLVVHVFSAERREFYGLERLWGDAPREAVPDDGHAEDVALLAESGSEPAT